MDSQPIRRRHLLAAGAAGLLGAAVPSAANAAAVDPDIDSTAVWGARPPRTANPVISGRPNKIIVHHTVSQNSTDYSRARAHAHARWVQNLHMDDNRWRDTGYNFIVSRGGWITEGTTGGLTRLHQGTSFIQGIHTSGQNTQALGIANEGAYHDGAVPPAAQWEVLVILCAYACDRYRIAPSQIFGHMDFSATQCPGIFHARLPRRRSVGAAARG
jgi:hypothetical protein